MYNDFGLDKADIGSGACTVFDAGHKDLVTHYRSVVEATSDSLAVARLQKDEEISSSMSFAELDRHARSVAAYFQRVNAQGSRAIMLFNTCLESVYSFLGCVYSKTIAVPLPAPDSAKLDRYLVRVKTVIADGGAKYVLTTSSIKQRLQSITEGIEEFLNIEWIAVDELPDYSEHWVHEAVDPSDIAYLQYTSGSTSKPKGVMISHANLLSNINYMGVANGYSTIGTGTVCWMPYFHDFGLIDGILLPLAFGKPTYLMSPFDFVQRPFRWVRAISRYKASHSAGPNFSYALVARKSVDEPELSELDLSCWKHSGNAAEPIRKIDVESFLRTFAPYGLARETVIPCYGLAENTLVATMAENGATYYQVDIDALENGHAVLSDGDNSRPIVGCGKVFKSKWDIDVRVVDPLTNKLKPNQEVGEVWLSGECVAKGYWEKEQATEEKFKAEIVDLPGRKYLRSGDLGFMIGDELVFTGRQKDLIIVEGRNIYPQDMELSVEKALPCLRLGCTVAFSHEDQDDTRVVVVCEVKDEYNLLPDDTNLDDDPNAVTAKQIKRSIIKEISDECQIRVHDVVVLPAGLLPKTTSGKVERALCKKKYLEGVIFKGVKRL
ncbi:fatty acyl-AMP ligase [Alteromonadaceae bacterium M269]|nr:fatty acyl-AMP ligase [Alteromonadaceae bacterium M269]